MGWGVEVGTDWVGTEVEVLVAGRRVGVGVHSPSPTKSKLKTGWQFLFLPRSSHPVTRKILSVFVDLNVPSPCHSIPKSLKNCTKSLTGVSVRAGSSVDGTAVAKAVAVSVLAGKAVGTRLEVSEGTEVSVGANVLVGTAVGWIRLHASGMNNPPTPRPINFNASLLSI